MPFPPSKKTMEGLLSDITVRLNLVERRLAIRGNGGSSGSNDDQTWVNLATTVVWGAGWSHVADAGSFKGIKARRVGNQVDFILGNVRAAAGTFTVGVTGNIANSVIFSGVPAKYRPPGGGIVGFASGPAGPIAAISMTSAGVVSLTAVVPNATQTGDVANPQVDFSAVASYRVD